MISAKRMGWDTIYDYYPFPTDKYSEESVRNQFKKSLEKHRKIMVFFMSIQHMNSVERYTIV